MQQKLNEMIMVLRPTSGNGMIPIDELPYLLQAIGFEFLTQYQDEIANLLDQGGTGFFYQNELVDYLVNTHVSKYTNIQALREAIQTFDHDGDGKIQIEEFEYFMRNFGDSENFYMDDNKIKQLLECAKPLDNHGNIEIERLVQNLTLCWKNINK